ncbi:hypothetical protein SCLCIDRAFT_71895, partial [Scleroderma citrinum Foug A]
LKCEWNSPIYAFFSPTPAVEYVGGCHSHVFKCTVKGCNKSHVKKCWGEDVLHQVFKAKNTKAVREAVRNYAANRSITMAFKQKKDAKAIFSLATLKMANKSNRMAIMQWVAENTCPFDIVNDNGFQCLMKTGRLDYYIPNPNTVSCDVRTTFVRVWQRLAEKLQAYNGELNFATDTWTAPNH